MRRSVKNPNVRKSKDSRTAYSGAGKSVCSITEICGRSEGTVLHLPSGSKFKGKEQGNSGSSQAIIGTNARFFVCGAVKVLA